MRIIKGQPDFDRIFGEGFSGGSHQSRVVWAPSSEAEGRVAFVAPKRIGCAVVRNRCKRVLRACAGEAGLPAAGKDVVLMATPATARATHDELVRSLRLSLKRAFEDPRPARSRTRRGPRRKPVVA